ncbi:hypothetical protein ACQKNS_03070 [Peribacillus sp. NPDC094092]|uniref:hypothetical protein n=1 Tax=Peribacillus sp. NPDC094092 TaxID=3390611 RepID=UPI003D036E0B
MPLEIRIMKLGIEEIVPSITHAMLINAGNVMDKGEKRDVLTESLLDETFRVPVKVEWENERPWIRIKSPSANSYFQIHEPSKVTKNINERGNP